MPLITRPKRNNSKDGTSKNKTEKAGRSKRTTEKPKPAKINGTYPYSKKK